MRVIIFVSVFLFLETYGLSAMQIVKDGNPEAIIITPEKATQSVLYAAEELKTYLKKISGADLQIMSSAPENTGKTLIYIGYDEVLRSKGLNISGLDHDGFKIVSGDRWLALFGRDYNGKLMAGMSHPFRLEQSYSEKFKINRYGETGTLFAVYNFLEKFCGIRWYMPGDLGEVAPTQKTLEIPANIDIMVMPDFKYRFLYSCDFPQDDDSVLWYRRAGFGASCPVNIQHSFHALKKYRTTHPEYFALINGQRDFNISCAGNGNLCLSNPDVLKCFINEAKEFFNKNPEQYIFPVMPNDSFTRICECAECQKQINEKGGAKGQFSDYVWNFVNEVAKEVKKSHPDKFIGCCVYGAYKTPPDKLEKLSANVVVMICKTRSEYGNPENKKYYNELIENWMKKIKPGNMYFWEYYNAIYSSPYLRNIPIVFPHIIAEDLKNLKGKSNGEFVEAQTFTRGIDTRTGKAGFLGLNHINWYVTAKLMWNADADVDLLLEEYYSKFYGPAKDEMRKFWEKSEGMWSRNVPDKNNELYRSLYTVQEVDVLMSHLRNARNKTEKDSLERKRIDLIISEIIPLETRVKKARLTEKPSYICQYVVSKPVLDGNSDDQCWTGLPFMEFVSQNGEDIPHSSRAMACFDDKNLYLFFKNYSPNADTVAFKTLCTQRDSMVKPYIWEDDSIEIFLNPTPGIEKKYYHIIVNAKGIILDQYMGHDKTPSLWNSNIGVSAKANMDSWALEVKIPLSDIGLANKEMDDVTITANFTRNQAEGNSVKRSCWSPTMTGSNHNASMFGRFRLKKNAIGQTIRNENNIYKLNSSGFSKGFIDAYECFLNAKAGDNDSYSKAALEFRNVFEKSNGDSHAQLTCLSLEALCSFLSLDIDKASLDVKKNLSLSLMNHPEDQLIKAVKEVATNIEYDGVRSFFKEQKMPECKRISDLAGLLIEIPEIENKTCEMSGKLKDKANYHLKNVDLKEKWAFTVLALSVLLEKSAPSFQLIEEKVCQAVCISNLRKLGMMLSIYAQGNDGHLPCVPRQLYLPTDDN